MVRTELNKRSPLRILEKSTKGGIGKGNIGVLSAPKGVGKTACLVHIATDQLFHDKHVIHVSFSDSVDHIVSWYEDIFQEISRRYQLDCAMEVHDTIIKNRVIMQFTQDGIHITQIEDSIRALIEQGHFSADTLVIDGYDFHRSSSEELKEFRAFARNFGLELWFSATMKPEEAEAGNAASELPGVLQKLDGEISVVVTLEPREAFTYLRLVKDHDEPVPPDMHLKLDPGILLIAEE
jgi:KaiC/GvpD/RAD55 family RecA-like ATPase